MKILLVDDDPLAGQIAAAILEDAGHEVFFCENALEAAEFLKEHPDVALIVSDMNMPLMSGVELFRELRSSGSKVPFIILSGNDDVTLTMQEPGLIACIIKDGDLEVTLPETIARVGNLVNI